MTGVADVLGDLGFQRREIRKVYFVSQLVQEAYTEVVAVEIGREIEQVNFQNRSRHLVDAGAEPEIGNAGMRSAGQARDFDREHAAQRWAVVAQADVGGGKAKLAGELLAAHDPSVDHVRPTEQGGGVFEAACGEGLAYR